MLPLCFVVLMAVGSAVRLAVGHQREVWLNEACSLIIARHSLPEIWQATAHDVHPPLFYFLLAAADRMTPDTVRAGRALSLLLSLGLIPLAYALGRLWFGRWGSLLAATLVAISPATGGHGTELRMYALVGLLAGGVLWAAFGLLRGESGLWLWAALVVGGTLGLYASYFFVPLLLAVGVAALASHAWERPALARWLAALLLIAVLWAPWWLAFRRAVRFVGATFWTEPVGLVEACRGCKGLLDAAIGLDQGWPHVPAWGDRLLRLAVLGLVTAGCVAASRRRPMRPLLVATATFFALTVAVSMTIRGVMVVRSLLLVAPVVFTLLVAGVRALPRSWRVAVAAVLVVLPVPRVAQMYGRSLIPGPLVTTAQIVEDFGRPGDTAAHTSMWTYYPLRYYTEERMEQRLLLPSNLSAQTAEALGEKRANVAEVSRLPGRLWLFVVDDPLHEGEDMEARRELCERRRARWQCFFGNVELLLLEERDTGPPSHESAPAALPEGR